MPLFFGESRIVLGLRQYASDKRALLRIAY